MCGLPLDPRKLPDASDCALLVIDMQVDFASPHGAMAAYGFDVTDVGTIVGPISRLVAAARRHQVPVIHTRMVNAVLQNAPSWTAFWGDPTVTVPGTPGASFIPELEPAPEDVVIEKYGYGAFFGTNLDTILSAMGVRVVIVVGTGPNICAGDTLHEAFARGYAVVAVEDALASFSRRGRELNQQLKETGLYIIANHYGLVCHSQDLIANWRQDA